MNIIKILEETNSQMWISRGEPVGKLVIQICQTD